MLDKKFILGVMLTFVCCSNVVLSAPKSSDTQILQATLQYYLDIQVESDKTLKRTIDSETGSLDSAFVSKFKIKSNTKDKTLYLQALADSDTASENAFYNDGTNTYVVLSHTTNKPTTAAITDCKSASSTAENNPNVIAYPITKVELTNNGSSSYDNSKNQYNIKIKCGETSATATTGTTIKNGTYSYEDTAGTYQATLTLTSVSL